MNEKRFTFDTKEKWFLFDNKTEEYMDMEDCKDKLNDQQATIDELEKNFEDLVDWATEIAKRNVVLDEEIGELRKDHAKWRRKCLDLLVIIRTELLPRISDDEVKRLKEIVDNG